MIYHKTGVYVGMAGEGGRVSRAACSCLGRRGFRSTTDKHFLGSVEAHKRWLRYMAAYNYGRSFPSSSGKGFPSLPLLHPARFCPAALYVFRLALYHGYTVHLNKYLSSGYITPDEFRSITVICGLDSVPF